VRDRSYFIDVHSMLKVRCYGTILEVFDVKTLVVTAKRMAFRI
jgi:hypothetical protein